MSRVVIKRDGTEVPFEWVKVERAVKAAFESNGKKVSKEVLQAIREDLSATFKIQGNKLSVEVVQDIVEDALMRSPFRTIAKSYILYRERLKAN